MSDIYEKRGYASRQLGFGKKPAVVVVDFQRGFIDPDFPMGGAPMVDKAVENTVPLMEAAKRAGLPVIACVNGYDTPRAAPPAASKLGKGVPSSPSTRACASMSRPPWVWNKAPVTLMA